MKELSTQQKKVISTKASKVIVASCAGSGKTLSLISRYNYLIEQGVDPKKIVLITFTNAAAEEISERLDKPKMVFIGTIHSYANYLLLSGGYETSDIIEREEFDRLFERIKQTPQCIKEVEHLLLDEGQDSTQLQFEFILDMVKPKNWMIFADWRQSIYRWNGATPDYILNLSVRDDVVTYDLDENYRNGSKILDFAKSIIRTNGYSYIDNSTPMRDANGRVIEIEYSPSALALTLKEYQNFGEWFILTRTNDQIDEITRYLAANHVPYDTFKRAQLDNKELNKKMKENTVKVLTIHTAKGLEAKNVIVIGAKFFSIEERCVSYVAATRARDLLVWTRMPNKTRKANMISNWER